MIDKNKKCNCFSDDNYEFSDKDFTTFCVLLKLL